MKQIKVELQEWMGNDRSIAEAAWTSSFDYQKKKNRTDEDVGRVVNMLADLKHSVPFESVVLRFWIKLPITADRQHMTHRIASHSGMSGRYRTMPNEFQAVPEDVKEIITKWANFYGSKDNLVEEYNELCEEANLWYKETMDNLKACEKEGAINNAEFKRLREFFRGVLPQNNMTERTTLMNLRSFSNYQKLRNSEHAQPEIRQMAKLMLQEVEEKNICPIALDALKRNEWVI
jgi:flavin-dependent thymidylate synthase